MAEELLERVLRERKARAQAAVDESRRLEAALAALQGHDPRARPPRTARKPRRAGRTPRGQTRAAILRAIGERPGASAGEIAAAAGVDRRVTHSTLARLVRQGELERYSPPGGGSAYRPPSPTSAPAAGDNETPTSGGPAGADALGEPRGQRVWKIGAPPARSRINRDRSARLRPLSVLAGPRSPRPAR